jgi:hypothetical protein
MIGKNPSVSKVSACVKLANAIGKVRECEDAFAPAGGGRVARIRRAGCARPRPEDLQVNLARLSRAESPNEPRLLPGSVGYFFLGAALGVEACCCFF